MDDDMDVLDDAKQQLKEFMRGKRMPYNVAELVALLSDPGFHPAAMIVMDMSPSEDYGRKVNGCAR